MLSRLSAPPPVLQQLSRSYLRKFILPHSFTILGQSSTPQDIHNSHIKFDSLHIGQGIFYIQNYSHHSIPPSAHILSSSGLVICFQMHCMSSINHIYYKSCDHSDSACMLALVDQQQSRKFSIFQGKCLFCSNNNESCKRCRTWVIRKWCIKEDK